MTISSRAQDPAWVFSIPPARIRCEMVSRSSILRMNRNVQPSRQVCQGFRWKPRREKPVDGQSQGERFGQIYPKLGAALKMMRQISSMSPPA